VLAEVIVSRWSGFLTGNDEPAIHPARTTAQIAISLSFVVQALLELNLALVKG